MQPPTSSNSCIEERLKQSESLLRIAGRMARIGGWAVELPADHVLWSDGVCAIHEVTVGTQPTVGEAIHFYAPEYREKIRKLFTACAQEGIPFDVELEIITAKGNRVWVRAIGEAERDPSGAIRRIQGAFLDRTDSKLAAERGHRIAEQLTNTLESITDAFFTLDCEWRFTYVNHEAERLMQRSREQLLGRVLWEEFKEAVNSRFYEEYHRAMREGCTVALEEFYAPSATWVEAKAYPSAEGLAVYFRDVTQQRRNSEELRLNEERLRLLSKASNNAIWDWDVIADKTWLNEGFLHLFGFAREEIKPNSSSFWIERIHSDDKKRVKDRLEKVIHQEGNTWSDEYRLMRKDGSYAFVLDRGHIIRNAGGRAIRMIGIMTDLTERRAAEEKMAEHAALLDKAQEAILVCDLKHQITFWNKSAERLYGWSAEQAMSRSCRELLHLNTDTFDQAMKRVLSHGDWIGELNQAGKGGRSFVVESHWTLVKDNSGQPFSVLIINTDITERKKLEQQFLRAQRMESIGTLAGGIAHDLNNVLAPILMSIEVLKLDEQDDERRDVLATIESSARRGAEMVKQVLTFARGVEGRRVGLNISSLLQAVEKMANETFLKSIQVRAITSPDLWTVSGDPTQIHQVLLNLCVNARDAMPTGGQLTLSAENVTLEASNYLLGGEGRPGNYVLIQVEDTGTGIAPEILEKIFDPFFTTKELGNGTGLGLSTCLAIVKSHGGLIQVDSEPGKGSRFKVYLPAEVKAASKGEPDEIAELPRGHGELILVVDDESAVREITRQTLEAFGYRVVLASDGTEAVGIYAKRKTEIAMVLTDLMMPVMDGPTTVQVLRKLNPRIRVITASGLNANRHIEKLASTETRHFLLKPYTAETLLKKVKEVLQEPA